MKQTDWRIKYNKETAARNRKVVRALKEATPCKDCGVRYPFYVMQYDHLRDKKANVAHMLQRSSLERLMKEIDKCELVCANCHAARTYKRRLSIQSDAPVL